MLDAPQLVDNYYLNVLDCGCRNVLAIDLGNTVYLWDASDSSTTELVTADEDNGPVTGVSWALDGRRIAITLNSSEIQLWNSSSSRLVDPLNPLFHCFHAGMLCYVLNRLFWASTAFFLDHRQLPSLNFLWLYPFQIRS